jgi:uncharacterized protein YlzI (FlbEa/FlbD family)
MNTLIRLTTLEDEDILVNPSHVVLAQQVGFSRDTQVRLTTGNTVLVKETVDQICVKCTTSH